MEVSVVITTFNRVNYLGEAIASVLNQTFQDFEIIVVDDGSTDNTRHFLQELTNPKIRYIYQENQGVGAARNTGVSACRGHLIALLDADDVWLPEKLELQVKALKSSPSAGVVYSNMYFFGAMGPNTPETFFELLPWPPPRGRVLDKMVVHSFGHPSTILIKRDVFEKIGIFDETLPHCDDYDMLIRMAAYFEFEVVPFPLVKYRLHPNQISRNAERVFIDHLTVFNKALQLPEISPLVRTKINRRAADFHFHYAVLLMRRGDYLKGLKEFLASIKGDVWRLFPRSLSIVTRAFTFLFK